MEKLFLKISLKSRMKKNIGEHPYGDVGQLILLIVFLIVWLGDSFFYHKSTFLSVYVPLYVRLVLLIIIEICAISLIRAGHAVVHDVETPKKHCHIWSFAFCATSIVFRVHLVLCRSCNFNSFASFPDSLWGYFCFLQLQIFL